MKTLKKLLMKSYLTELEHPLDGRREATFKTTNKELCKLFAYDLCKNDVNLIEEKILKNSAIEDINEFQKNEKMDVRFFEIYHIKPPQAETLQRQWSLSRECVIGYIKKKFNITEDDLKPKVESFEIKPPQERQGTRHMPKMAEKYKEDLK